jgi:pimeloyl-ACP methyl ester carboxylesterase
MHEEALVTLPELLERFRIERPILVGHSDGASIALIHAGEIPDSVLGVVAEAPHVFVEDLTIDGIAAARRAYRETDLRTRLARHHGPNTDAMFDAWADVWLGAQFRDWNIEHYLQRIVCPIMVVQGLEDPYGTTQQVEAIRRGAGGKVRTMLLEGCGHTPHRERRTNVLDGIESFVNELVQNDGAPPPPDSIVSRQGKTSAKSERSRR